MTNNFTQRGSNFFVGKKEDSTTYNKLPGRTYTVHYSEMSGYYLEQISDFALPDKTYGDVTRRANRILETFFDRKSSTGVHLDGVKGSGKTLLVKALSTYGREMYGVPTVVINQPYHGDEFNSFIQSIDCDTIVVFDEFEKTYNWETQPKILTLFDGTYQSRKLFLLTTNNSRECSDYLKNRPGRMFYSLSFDVLDETTVREVLEDKLLDETQLESVIRYAQVFTFLNFDMLVAIIEEMNRYDETLEDVLKMLNVQPQMRRSDKFKVSLIVNSQEPYDLESISGYDPNTWSDYFDGRLINQAALPQSDRSDDDDDDDDLLERIPNIGAPNPAPTGTNQPSAVVAQSSRCIDDNDEIRIGPQDLTAFDAGKGVFTYNTTRDSMNIVLLVTREVADITQSSIFNINAL